MADSTDFRRCGQCGRTFNKTTWKSNNYWCPTCKKYICFSCKITTFKCPACEGRVNRTMNDYFVFALIFGFIFFIFGLIMNIISMFQHPFPYAMMIVGLIGFMFAITFKEKLNDQIKLHRKHILKLPSGIIPKKARKRKSKSVEEHITRKPGVIGHGLLEESQYMSLEGEWTAPVLSETERLQAVRKFRNQFLPTGIILTIIGAILLAIWYIYDIFIILGLWIIPLSLGVIFVVTVVAVQMKAKTKGPFQLMVPMKRTNIQKMKNTIDKYLEETNEKYMLENKKKSMSSLYTFPKYYYTFENGNFLYFTAADPESSMGGSNYLVIGYTYDHEIHAKKIQRELDKILSDEDFIYTIR